MWVNPVYLSDTQITFTMKSIFEIYLVFCPPLESISRLEPLKPEDTPSSFKFGIPLESKDSNKSQQTIMLAVTES